MASYCVMTGPFCMAGEGKKYVVEIGHVQRDVLHGVDIDLAEHVPHGPCAVVADDLKGQVAIVAAGTIAELSGGCVECGCRGELQQRVTAGHAPLQLGGGALSDDPTIIEHRDQAG